MASAPSQDWRNTLAEFLIHLEAHRAPKTVEFYKVQLRMLISWAEENQISQDEFGKRHMDRYLAHRATTVAKTTLHHDGVAAKSFFKWAVRNDLAVRNPLADYEVRKAPTPAKYMPTEDDVRALLRGAQEFWNPKFNASSKYFGAAKRTFHRDRNFALLMVLLDTACRIGEGVSFSVDDWRPAEMQLTVRESKGRKSRVLPVSKRTADALEVWLRHRTRIMKDAEEDEGYLFVSEFGGRMDESKFLKSCKNYARYVGINEKVVLHGLRRFTLNKLVKVSPMSAKWIAGHQSLTTTMIYTELDADHMREKHAETDVMGFIFNSRREKRKRLI